MLLEVTPVGVFFIVLGGVALIALVSFILFRILRPKLKQDDKPQYSELAIRCDFIERESARKLN